MQHEPHALINEKETKPVINNHNDTKYWQRKLTGSHHSLAHSLASTADTSRDCPVIFYKVFSDVTQ